MEKLKIVLFGIFIIIAGLKLFGMFLGGRYEGVRNDTPFRQAHQTAVRTFVESEGFGISRMKKKKFWNEMTINLNEQTYFPDEIHLIGFTTENGPRRFYDDRPQEKAEIAESRNRPLNPDELNAMESLQLGEVGYETLPVRNDDSDGNIRVIAPIFASKDCLKCHSVETGDLLGAFEYLLRPR